MFASKKFYFWAILFLFMILQLSCIGSVSEPRLVNAQDTVSVLTNTPPEEPLKVTKTADPAKSPTATPTLYPEPEGCLRPPDDLSRIEVNGHELNMRTYAMLQHAASIYGGPCPL